MTELIRKNLGWFLSGVLISLIVAFCFVNIFSINAQEQIKIFPTVFDGDWQNPEAAFSQDLPETAASIEFNIVNSTYSLEIPEFPIEEAATPPREGITLPIEEEIPTEEVIEEEAEEPTSFWNKVKNFFEEVVFAQEETQDEEEILPPEEEPITEEPIIEEIPPEEQLPQGEPSDEPVIEEPVVEEETLSIEKILELSNFGVSEEFKETEIINAQLRMSLAGRGEAGNRLIVEYFYQELWQSLADFDLENEISNALNEGYFLYALPIFENWDDLGNLKIKFTYLTENPNQDPEVYLDAVWLEVEYKEIEEEEKEFELRALKKSWRADEEPAFELIDVKEESKGLVGKFLKGVVSLFKTQIEPEIEVNLTNPKNKTLVLKKGEDFSTETHSPTKIKVFKTRDLRPGLHKLKISFEKNGKTYILEQEFTWGVLAININKSIYLLEERAYLQMAALRDDGHTICDANLRLEVISPDAQKSYPEIQESGKCGANNVTDFPDYFAYYQVGEAGRYEMKLTNLDNGYEITDSFEVRDRVSFEVERVGPTRIYPPATYEMRIKIKVNQDFVGEVIENLPESFEIFNCSSCLIRSFKQIKQVVWGTDWKAGETYELKYQFDAPDISPQFYLLGPLKFQEF